MTAAIICTRISEDDNGDHLGVDRQERLHRHAIDELILVRGRGLT